MVSFLLIGLILYWQCGPNKNIKVYKNNDFKYEIAYPREYSPMISVMGKNDPWASYVTFSNSESLDTIFTVSVQKLSLKESADWSITHTNFKLIKQEDFLLWNKYPGKKIYFLDPYSNNSTKTEAVINNGLYSYTIDDFSNNLDGILESFKFTK